MKLKMLQTRSGSPDGVTVNRYERGAVYEVPAALAEVFLDQGWARRAAPPRSKNAGAAPENKAAPKPRRRHGA